MKTFIKALLLAFLLAASPRLVEAQTVSLRPSWTCSLVALGNTLTECQAVPSDAKIRYVITDIVVQTTTGTAGSYAVQMGTGTNCGTGTAPLFPIRNAADRFIAPINTQPTAVISPMTPIVATAGTAICVIGTATNTINIQIIGFTTR